MIAAKVKEMGLRLDLDQAVRILDPGVDRGGVRTADPGIPAPGRSPRHPARSCRSPDREPAVGRRGDAAA